MKENGKLVISLDFELLWGMRDIKGIKSYRGNILGVRQSIPKMIEIFNEYEINATFSTVGFLFAKNKNEILEFSPKIKPKYINKSLSPYSGYFDEIGDNENVDKLHFATGIIKELKKHSNHENLYTYFFALLLFRKRSKYKRF